MPTPPETLIMLKSQLAKAVKINELRSAALIMRKGKAQALHELRDLQAQLSALSTEESELNTQLKKSITESITESITTLTSDIKAYDKNLKSFNDSIEAEIKEFHKDATASGIYLGSITPQLEGTEKGNAVSTVNPPIIAPENQALLAQKTTLETEQNESMSEILANRQWLYAVKRAEIDKEFKAEGRISTLLEEKKQALANAEEKYKASQDAIEKIDQQITENIRNTSKSPQNEESDDTPHSALKNTLTSSKMESEAGSSFAFTEGEAESPPPAKEKYKASQDAITENVRNASESAQNEEINATPHSALKNTSTSSEMESKAESSFALAEKELEEQKDLLKEIMPAPPKKPITLSSQLLKAMKINELRSAALFMRKGKAQALHELRDLQAQLSALSTEESELNTQLKKSITESITTLTSDIKAYDKVLNDLDGLNDRIKARIEEFNKDATASGIYLGSITPQLEGTEKGNAVSTVNPPIIAPENQALLAQKTTLETEQNESMSEILANRQWLYAVKLAEIDKEFKAEDSFPTLLEEKKQALANAEEKFKASEDAIEKIDQQITENTGNASKKEKKQALANTERLDLKIPRIEQRAALIELDTLQLEKISLQTTQLQCVREIGALRQELDNLSDNGRITPEYVHILNQIHQLRGELEGYQKQIDSYDQKIDAQLKNIDGAALIADIADIDMSQHFSVTGHRALASLQETKFSHLDDLLDNRERFIKDRLYVNHTKATEMTDSRPDLERRLKENAEEYSKLNQEAEAEIAKTEAQMQEITEKIELGMRGVTEDVPAQQKGLERATLAPNTEATQQDLKLRLDLIKKYDDTSPDNAKDSDLDSDTTPAESATPNESATPKSS